MLLSAHHRHIGSLIDIMHTEQRVQVPIQNDRHLIVEFVPSGNNISIKLDPHGAYGDVAIRFSRDLARILGFNELRYAHDATAPLTVSIAMEHIFLIYVYCDLLEHVVVGDTKAPLLRIVDRPPRMQGNSHTIFNPILYVCLLYTSDAADE